MNPIDNVPADEKVLMTEFLHRAFKGEGCDPECHCCYEDITPGMKFWLATLGDKDQMLCGNCTKADLEAAIEDRAKKLAAHYASPSYRGYTRPTRAKP